MTVDKEVSTTIVNVDTISFIDYYRIESYWCLKITCNTTESRYFYSKDKKMVIDKFAVIKDILVNLSGYENYHRFIRWEDS